jgi:hypothetical protein
MSSTASSVVPHISWNESGRELMPYFVENPRQVFNLAAFSSRLAPISPLLLHCSVG